MYTRSDIIDMSQTVQNQSEFSRATSIRCSSAKGGKSGFNVMNHTQTEYELEFLDLDDEELEFERDINVHVDPFLNLPNLKK